MMRSLRPGFGRFSFFSKSYRFCVISLTYIMVDLCVLCVFVVPSTPSLGEIYLRIHFTHQIQESHFCYDILNRNLRRLAMKLSLVLIGESMSYA